MNRAERRQQQKNEQNRAKSVLLRGTPYEKLQCGASFQTKKDFKQALRYYENVLRENPNHVEALYLKGGLLGQLEKFEAAKQTLKKCLELKEDAGPAHHNLGWIYLEEGHFEQAEKHFARALEINPNKPNTRFFLEMAQKRNNNKASPDYIKVLYEAGASQFENSLVNNLKYTAPQILMEKIKKYLTAPLEKNLDLGCGTGLMGIELQPYVKDIYGVDIAENMIKEAEKKKCYHELSTQPLEAYMQATKLTFDMITAADVLIYVGPLEKTFEGAKSCIKSGGLFAFTTEKLDENHPEDIWLSPENHRHKHKDTYVRRLADDYGFEVICLDGGVSRYENKKPVQASYIILQRK